METGQGGVVLALHAQDRRPRSPPYSACPTMTSRGPIPGAARRQPRPASNDLERHRHALQCPAMDNLPQQSADRSQNYYCFFPWKSVERRREAWNRDFAEFDEDVLGHFFARCPEPPKWLCAGGIGWPSCHRGDRLTESNCAETSGISSPWYAKGKIPVGSGRPAGQGASEPDFG